LGRNKKSTGEIMDESETQITEPVTKKRVNWITKKKLDATFRQERQKEILAELQTIVLPRKKERDALRKIPREKT
jgi:hypothetical protein